MIVEYISSTDSISTTDLDKSDRKEESKAPERPRKIFENAQGIFILFSELISLEKKISEMVDPNDPSAISTLIMQVNYQMNVIIIVLGS